MIADPQAPADGVLVVDPTCIRQIGGISELNRETYFGLNNAGAAFDRRCADPQHYEYLIHELGVTFGHKLGVVLPVARYTDAIREDPDHRGYADLRFLREQSPAEELYHPSPAFRRDTHGRLEVAAVGWWNDFPQFMGTRTTPQAAAETPPKYYPENAEAAVELAAAVLQVLRVAVLWKLLFLFSGRSQRGWPHGPSGRGHPLFCQPLSVNCQPLPPFIFVSSS